MQCAIGKGVESEGEMNSGEIDYPRIELAIVVWKWDDAPDEYRNISTNGGDEDWVAFVPEHMAKDWIPWMMEGGEFGCCHVREYEVRGGVIRIGAHA